MEEQQQRTFTREVRYFTCERSYDLLNQFCVGFLGQGFYIGNGVSVEGVCQEVCVKRFFSRSRHIAA